MQIIKRSQKACATCQYWTGLRQLAPGCMLRFEGSGTCTALRSSYRGRETRALQRCSYWHKWVAL